MRNRPFRLGLSIIAGSLSFVGSASAVDLIIDGSYESSTNNIGGVIGSGGDPAGTVDGGWTSFTTYVYAANYTQPGPTGCGQVYLRPYSPNQTVSQTVSLTRAITGAQIDSSTGQYSASAWFCTYHANNDYSDLTLQFLDATMNPIGNPVAMGGAAFVAALPTDPASQNRAWGQDTRSGVIPVGARYASVTTVSHALSGQPDGYVDLVSLDVTSAFVPVRVSVATPANGATGVNLGTPVSVTLQDGTQPLNLSSVSMMFDNAVVTPTIQQGGGATTLQYYPPGLLPSASAHTYKVAFGDRGGATPTVTNEYAFTVATWQNVNLGPAIHLETFDGIAEGALPNGWTVQHFTDPDVLGYDLNDFHSDAYLNWVVISRSTLSNLFNVVDGGEDFPPVLNVAPNQVINDSLVTNLLDGNFIFGVSDRNTMKQVQYLFTRDYDLSGKSSVYLSFHSAWTQNQDSMAAVEYSIDGGTTWLPVIYMLDGPDIVRDGTGAIDASNTLAQVRGDVPNLEMMSLSGGYYGQFVGVNSNLWASLGPQISARVDDNQFESKRVEILRLPQADNRPAVRLRFATMGTWSWYWAVDNIGFYSIATVEPPTLSSAPTPAAQTVALGNAATFTIAAPSGTGPFSYQWRHDGTNLTGKTTQTVSFRVQAMSEAGAYDVVASNAGGSVTSPPPAAVLTVINPTVFVTGQWDFDGNLKATLGRDLEYFDATVQADTTFGTTTSMGIPDINGQPASVMHFAPSTTSWGGYKVYHGAAPNGGGDYVNQYTLIYDVYYPFGGRWRSLWQTSTANANDGDLFINDTTGGVGISGNYQGVVTPGAWHRLAFAFDLTGPGEAPVLTKFIDGVKVGNQTGGLSGRDGRFSLDPFALLFADQDGDWDETIVSSFQFSNGRRPDAYLEALGGASARKIPGVVTATLETGRVVIRWTGGIPLETAPAVTGPWSVVNGAVSPYTVPTGANTGFYRPKLF